MFCYQIPSDAYKVCVFTWSTGKGPLVFSCSLPSLGWQLLVHLYHTDRRVIQFMESPGPLSKSALKIHTPSQVAHSCCKGKHVLPLFLSSSPLPLSCSYPSPPLPLSSSSPLMFLPLSSSSPLMFLPLSFSSHSLLPLIPPPLSSSPLTLFPPLIF